MEALIREAVAEAKNVAQAPSVIRIGMMETYAAIHLSAVLAAFPGQDVIPVTGPSAEMAEKVRAGGLDFAVISSGVRTPDLEVAPLAVDEFHLARGRIPRGPDLDRVLVIRGIDALLRSQILEALTETHGRTPVVLEVGSLDAIRASVEAGVGCTVLPGRYLRALVAAHSPIEVLPIKRRLRLEAVAVRRRDHGSAGAWHAPIGAIRDPMLTGSG